MIRGCENNAVQAILRREYRAHPKAPNRLVQTKKPDLACPTG
jgi:hypothetical protein